MSREVGQLTHWGGSNKLDVLTPSGCRQAAWAERTEPKMLAPHQMASHIPNILKIMGDATPKSEVEKPARGEHRQGAGKGATALSRGDGAFISPRSSLLK